MKCTARAPVSVLHHLSHGCRPTNVLAMSDRTICSDQKTSTAAIITNLLEPHGTDRIFTTTTDDAPFG
ncbi:hypothetical protein ACLOJK_018610 [Asimina triloba]